MPSLKTSIPDGEGPATGDLKEPNWAPLGGSGRADGETPNLEAYVAEQRTLRNHLAEQLALAFSDPARRLIGHHLIDLTDEAGYLQGDLEALGRAARRAARARRGNA